MIREKYDNLKEHVRNLTFDKVVDAFGTACVIGGFIFLKLANAINESPYDELPEYQPIEIDAEDVEVEVVE